MSIQIVLIVLIVIILWRIIDRFVRKEINRAELFAWVVFWLLAIGFVLWPDASSRLAELVGVGRGVDLMVYLAVVLIFYLLFRVFVRIEKMERNITKIVSELALRDSESVSLKETKSDNEN